MQILPKEVISTLIRIEESGYEAYIVGGCVRDLLLGRAPADWDITTSATPEQITKLFDHAVYENDFGTVQIITESEDPTLKVIEVTTFRTDGEYSDRRRPDTVTFASSLKEDVLRRDFTINALALTADGKVIDHVDGQKDLEGKVIRTVGQPKERFEEDALRLLRAVRIATQLDFELHPEIKAAIQQMSPLLTNIAFERIQQELNKLLMTSQPMNGLLMLEELQLLGYIIPELLEGKDVDQSGHHIYTVFEHNLRSMQYAAEQNWPLEIRLAALLHDIAKPRTLEMKNDLPTFYNHEIVGAQLTHEILERLKYPMVTIKKVRKLVRYHMFYYEVEEVSESSVRRLLQKVGHALMDDLIKVRMADRIGSGVPKAEPYRLRHFQYLVDKVSRDPISVKMLAINGNMLITELGVQPGPIIGDILEILLDEVLEDPQRNQKAHLMQRAKELTALPLAERVILVSKAQSNMSEAEDQEIDKLKESHHV